jgi:hypothetical protein
MVLLQAATALLEKADLLATESRLPSGWMASRRELAGAPQSGELKR